LALLLVTTANDPAAATGGAALPPPPGTQWFQTVDNCQKLSSLDVFLRIFPSKFQQIYLISVSGHSLASCSKFVKLLQE
jgi:hypothetical protein